MDTVTQVQNLDKAVFISNNVNTFGKSMNPAISQAMGK